MYLDGGVVHPGLLHPWLALWGYSNAEALDMETSKFEHFAESLSWLSAPHAET
jgi:hypothetical protein